MAEHKKQHFVPRSYLQAWCDPNTPEGQAPYVWVFSKDGSNPHRRAPGNLFHETDLYTIELPGGVRNLVLEHGLSQLENEFVSIRDRILQAQQPLQAAMVATIEVATPLLMDLDLAVLACPDGASGFLTSDNPCVWFDAEACKRPPYLQSPALIYESIEITLPISPRQIVFLNRRGVKGYLAVPGKFVDQLNRRTRFECRDQFVNNTNAVRSFWFDPGVEPEDSWRKRHPESMNRNAREEE